MSDQFLNKAGLSRVWTRIRAQQRQALAPLFEAERRGPAGMVSFEADYGGLPLKALLAEIKPYQRGSGDPSPTNVRAISGWTGAKVHATGKNLLEITVESTTISGVTFTVNRNTDGSVTSIVANGTATATVYFRIGRMDMRAGVTYALSGCPSGYSNDECWLYVSSQPESFGYFLDRGSGATKTLTQDYNGILYYIRILNGATVNNATFYPMVRDASTSAIFEPLIGGTREIAFPSEAGTVYGGTLDVLKGTLTVDRTVMTLNGSETFYQAGNGTIYVATTADCPPSAERDLNVSKTICSCLIGQGAWTSIPTLTNSCLVYKLAGWPNSRICLNVSGITTKEGMAAWCAQNTPTVSWLRETPITYQLTPELVAALAGQNNFWADCGDVTVEYGAFLQALQQEIGALGR